MDINSSHENWIYGFRKREIIFPLFVCYNVTKRKMGFSGKQNEDRFIFNNYSFVPLITMRFPGKKYSPILIIIFMFLEIFFMGILLKPNFIFFPYF